MSDRISIKNLVHLLEEHGISEGYLINNGDTTSEQGTRQYDIKIRNIDQFNALAKALGIKRIERRQEDVRGIPPVRLFYGHKGWTIYTYQPMSGG